MNATGCHRPSAPPSAATTTAAAGSRFDPATAGTIHGRVAWDGPVPQVPGYDIAAVDPAVGPPHGAFHRANPNAPHVNARNGGVKGAVVFLRGVDPARGRPWDHPPVCVEQADFDFRVRQTEAAATVGFVRRGDAVSMVSRQPELHSLHADGAAFFTLPFPKPDQPQSRRLDRPGAVELRSGCSYYWMRGYLFVDDHPYYTCTDDDGGFVLRDVPPGDLEVVCWLPNWRERKRDLDPETCIVLRLFYHPPATKTAPAHLGPGGKAAVDFHFGEADFAP